MTDAAPSALRSLVLRLGALGDVPSDDDEARLRKRILIFAGIGMSGGGLLWGSLSVMFGLLPQSSVPFGYIVITAVNLLLLSRTRNFGVARMVQLSASLLLPFAFQ